MNCFRGTSRCASNCFLAFLHTPQVRNDGDAAGVHVHHCGIFVGIGKIFGDLRLSVLQIPIHHRLSTYILNEQLIRLALHISPDEACQVQIGLAIEIQLVLEHLMDGISWRSTLGNPVLRDLLGAGVAGGVGGRGRVGVLGVNAVFGTGTGVGTEVLDELVGVDLEYSCKH